MFCVGFTFSFCHKVFQNLDMQKEKGMSHVFMPLSETSKQIRHLGTDATHGPMHSLLLPIVSLLPALAAISITRPLWKVRELSNATIQSFGLLVMLGGMAFCLIAIFNNPSFWSGIASLALLTVNPVVFKAYERRLNTARCPQCRTCHLQARRINGHFYRVHCPHCGFCDEWRR